MYNMYNYSSIIRRMGHTLLIQFSWRTGLGRFITFSQSSVLVTPAFSTCVTSCHLFHSRVFHPCHLVPRFPLPRFPPVSLRATFSTPAFSTHVTSCRVFHSCVFLPCIFDGATFSTPAFSVAPCMHFKLNRAFKVIQGHPYWCRQGSRTVYCRNVQLLMPTLFLKLTNMATGKRQIRRFQ